MDENKVYLFKTTFTTAVHEVNVFFYIYILLVFVARMVIAVHMFRALSKWKYQLNTYVAFAHTQCVRKTIKKNYFCCTI